MLLFVGRDIRNNQWIEFSIFEAGLKRVAKRLPAEKEILISLDEKHKP